ncbi:Oidioi.mRNA.OKI2018_I69.chr1.g44.t1.cds [Oikopleura dioica]|uniref:Oidioi.mRNA.OKI2018_I69.chr1.g44.t1.cds n=1 Tax=Oikopleura dioica TaxID=34765 RepID=A0ABN7SIL5_OIKDI|nr:Oidioi.mRNA.OKI2018_I69.chr1.g44.t1.cds [Oikopleura dioica]
MILNVQQNAPPPSAPPSPAPAPVVIQQQKSSNNAVCYVIIGCIFCPCIFISIFVLLGVGAAATTAATSGSENYPSHYQDMARCTNKFYSTFDGLTFEFTSFNTEQHYDFLVFRDSNGQDYEFSGQLTGTRISFDSDVTVHFHSDDMVQMSGFRVMVIDGYESWNDIDTVYPSVKLTGEAPPKEETN